MAATPEIRPSQALEAVQRLLWRSESYEREAAFIEQKRAQFDADIQELLWPCGCAWMTVENTYIKPSSEIVSISDFVPVGVEGGHVGFLWATINRKDRYHRIHFSKQDPWVEGLLSQGEILVESSAGQDWIVCGRSVGYDDIEIIFTLLGFIKQHIQRPQEDTDTQPRNPVDLMEQYLPSTMVHELLDKK